MPETAFNSDALDILHGNVLTDRGWIRGNMQFGRHIATISGQAQNPLNNGDDYILPGFIDLHVHGGGGQDTMQAGDAVRLPAPE